MTINISFLRDLESSLQLVTQLVSRLNANLYLPNSTLSKRMFSYKERYREKLKNKIIQKEKFDVNISAI